mmetsp:Transcript_9814/g.15817  ORF Transcript_9814/g.15817 Transcript_9814/m.15817 type:complete len:289 (+) Transcript_9814:72-938(+)
MQNNENQRQSNERKSCFPKKFQDKNGKRQRTAVEDILWVHEEDEVWHMKKSDDDNQNIYYRVDAKEVKLRGKKYLTDRKKYPSKEAAYKLVCSKCFKTEEKMLHAAVEVDTLKDYLEKNLENEYMVINWLVPGYYTVVNLYVRTLENGKDPAFDKLIDTFRRGDDKFRSSRFKLLPKLLEAPSAIVVLLRTVIGTLRPVLIGNKLTCYHYTGKNYMEVDIDTGSSFFVCHLASSMVRAFQGIVVNQGFAIEGRDESELPERMLGIQCYSRISIEKIIIQLGQHQSKTV